MQKKSNDVDLVYFESKNTSMPRFYNISGGLKRKQQNEKENQLNERRIKKSKKRKTKSEKVENAIPKNEQKKLLFGHLNLVIWEAEWEKYIKDGIHYDSVIKIVDSLLNNGERRLAERGKNIIYKNQVYIRIQKSAGNIGCIFKKSLLDESNETKETKNNDEKSFIGLEKESHHPHLIIQQIMVNPKLSRQGYTSLFLNEIVKECKKQNPFYCIQMQCVLTDECRSLMETKLKWPEMLYYENCYVRCNKN